MLLKISLYMLKFVKFAIVFYVDAALEKVKLVILEQLELQIFSPLSFSVRKFSGIFLKSKYL